MRQLSKIIPNLARGRLDLGRIAANQHTWRRIAPAELSQHTQLLLAENGESIIYADSPVWANIALNLKPTILYNLNEAGFNVSALRIRVNPSAGAIGKFK